MKYIFPITTFIIVLIPVLVSADTIPQYSPLVNIPIGVDSSGNTKQLAATTSFNDYINALYALSISLAALLAVIKIVIAGIKWMMTDVVTSKGEAKEDIKGALVGLLIVLGAVLILTVINPDLVEVELNLQPTQVESLDSSSSNLSTTVIGCVSSGTGGRSTLSPCTSEINTCESRPGAIATPDANDTSITCTVPTGNTTVSCTPVTTQTSGNRTNTSYDCSAQIADCRSSGGNPVGDDDASEIICYTF
jgi:hypothetical protein